MGSIKNSPLPEEALLRLYLRDGHYTDCYSTDISQSVMHSQYIAAFYTTFLFKIERFVLRLAVSRPSTDTEAVQLAEKQRDSFAAWSVEARDNDQLLLCDFHMENIRAAILFVNYRLHLALSSRFFALYNKATEYNL